MITLYVIQLQPGLYAQGANWRSTRDIAKAKFYTGTGPARGAIAYHRDSWEGRRYKPVLIEINATIGKEIA